MRVRLSLLVLALAMVAAGWGANGDEAPLLLQGPTLSKTEIVFSYGGYLWSVSREGGAARQLTTGGHEASPIFSPDAKSRCVRNPGYRWGTETIDVAPRAGWCDGVDS